MIRKQTERWGTRAGVILAVAGSAVGLGNFLRFPGQVAEYGGGAFMLAYFIAFLLLGLPICWAEWTMGRYGGRYGCNSCPAVLAAIARRSWGKYVGICGVLVPVIIYMYYVYIEAWCLGYAVNFLLGNFDFTTVEESRGFWHDFIGVGADGAALGFGVDKVSGFLIFVFLLNFLLIYRGLSRGIEFFCKYAMPLLVVLAFIVLVRVLTLGAPDGANPDHSVANGLGYLWNPTKTFVVSYDATGDEVSRAELVGREVINRRAGALAADEAIVELSLWQQLMNGRLWLAATSQIFFSLSVGFGVIITYASYLRRSDDIVLSGLAATSANEFCEVALGGLITVPAAFAFIGAAALAGAGLGTFSLGFQVLPLVFSAMPAGNIFGAMFFFLLFLAAVTSSLSMLQPGIAFVEESLGLRRKHSVLVLGVITTIGTLYVVYFSAGVAALSTLDFWVGQVLIYILATVQIILFGWVLGIRRGFLVAHEGAAIRIPRVYGFIMKFVCPLFLLTVFFGWVVFDVLGLGGGDLDPNIVDLIGDPEAGVSRSPVAWMGIGLIVSLALLCVLAIRTSPLFERLSQRMKMEDA